MTGFRERDGVLHGFGVANFADENDVRRLAQRVLQRAMPRMGVDADFALLFVHQRMRKDFGNVARQLLRGQRLYGATRIHARRKICRDEKIRAIFLRHRAEELVHVGACLFFVQGRHGATFVVVMEHTRSRRLASNALLRSE